MRSGSPPGVLDPDQLVRIQVKQRQDNLVRDIHVGARRNVVEQHAALRRQRLDHGAEGTDQPRRVQVVVEVRRQQRHGVGPRVERVIGGADRVRQRHAARPRHHAQRPLVPDHRLHHPLALLQAHGGAFAVGPQREGRPDTRLFEKAEVGREPVIVDGRPVFSEGGHLRHHQAGQIQGHAAMLPTLAPPAPGGRPAPAAARASPSLRKQSGKYLPNAGFPPPQLPLWGVRI